MSEMMPEGAEVDLQAEMDLAWRTTKIRNDSLKTKMDY